MHAPGATEQALAERIGRALALIDARDARLCALLPEPARAERLHAEARALVRAFPDPGRRPPLFGTLVAIKDCIRVDGLPTRAGSRLPPDCFAGPEGAAVARLRAAGALILGKAVTTEFTLGTPGPTRNPLDPAHTPGGSSSGSAAAVAAGYAPLALGTQTGGSVIRPAAFCGVVGFKPTWGRVPADGVVHYAPSFDHVGWLAADVATALRAGAVLCDGWDTGAAAARAGPRPVIGITGAALLEAVEAPARAAFEEQIDRLRAAGYDMRATDLPHDPDAMRTLRREQALAELAEVHRDWFAAHEALYAEATVRSIRAGQAVAPERLAALRAALPAARAEADAAMARAGVDLLALPAAPGPAPAGLASTGNSVLNQPFSFTGQPALSLPCAPPSGGHLPLGLQLVAPGGRDEALLGWAGAIAAALEGAG